MPTAPPRPHLVDRLRAGGARAVLHGPPPTLPELLDRASERWFGLPPRVRAGLVALLLVGLLVAAGAGTARSPWGPPVEVVVTGTDVAAGAPLGGGGLRTERRPASLVPRDALLSPAEAEGARAAGTLVAGTVLTARHLAGEDPVAATLAAGRAAYPVDAGAFPTLRAGQQLDLVAGDLEGRGRLLARNVRVVAVTDGTVWLDVAREDAPGIAAAALRDGLQVVLLGP